MTKRTELPPPGVRIRPEGVAAPVARTRWAWITGTFFGIGHLKPGPGTWASLAAATIWYFGMEGTHLTGWMVGAVTLAGAVAATWVGIPAATVVERESGGVDPGFVVIDEVAGQWIALTVVSVEWGHGLLAFVLFRVFDITKPWPARRLERLPGGQGIMLDDVAAGVYAMLIMLIVQIWW